MSLPAFAYHPDPILSGSIATSDANCACCGQPRGYIYTGPVYSEQDELGDAICPWCIADGSAHEKFDATFVDDEGIDGEIREEALDEVTTRTPGFNSWQSEQWMTCCGDAMAFVEPFGAAEVNGKYIRRQGDVMTYIVHEMGISGGAATRLMNSLNREKGPTAYLFQCRHCDTQKVYIDTP